MATATTRNWVGADEIIIRVALDGWKPTRDRPKGKHGAQAAPIVGEATQRALNSLAKTSGVVAGARLSETAQSGWSFL